MGKILGIPFGFGNKKEEQMNQIRREQAYKDFDNLKFS